MIVLSLAYMLLFPPVTVPDEQAHYISAYRMSNFFLFHWGQWGNPDVLMRAADFNFFDQFDSNGYVSGETYRLLADNFSLFADGTEQVIYSADAVTNVPLGYLASALGIALGRLFHLGGVPVFYLGPHVQYGPVHCPGLLCDAADSLRQSGTVYYIHVPDGRCTLCASTPMTV